MSNKEKLINYLIEGKKEDETWDLIASKFGLTTEAARHTWRKYREDHPPIDIIDKPITVSSFDENIKEGKATLSGVVPKRIESLEQLIDLCKIDTNKWEVERYLQNYWGNENHPHWQVKAWLVRKKEDEVSRIESLLSKYRSKYVPIKKKDLIINDSSTKPVSLFISLADPHIDKKTLDKTSMDVKISDYLHVLDNLLYRSYKSHSVEEIVYVLGNDYFTSDNYFPSTTKDTPQFITDEYDESYEKGFNLAVTAINKLKQFCNKLRVVFVPANHDRTKSFYLLHALEVYFRADSTITFDRTAENTKVYSYGVTMIGMHHGDTIEKDMPMYFASKYRKQWGAAKYTEIALADKHHKKEWKFKLSCEEVASTRMFISPSLTSADVWHKDKNFDLCILAGTVRIYDKEKGFIGELEERI